MPERKHKRTAKSGPRPDTWWKVIRDINAVGPIVMSRTPPKIAYMKHPANAEYNPY